MPIGPNREKRPASSHAAAIMTAKIATGEIEEQYEDDSRERPARRSILLRVTKDSECQSERQDGE